MNTNRPKYYCTNGFRTVSYIEKGVIPNVRRKSGARVCTSACCMTIIGGRLHRCAFLAQVKR